MNEFRTKLKWNGDKIKMNASRASEESIFALGVYAEERAKQYAAKWYGYLAASINTQSKSRGTNVEEPQRYARYERPNKYTVKGFENITKPRSDRTVFVGTNVVYAMAIEFGGSYRNGGVRPPKPYLRPALQDAQNHALEILKPRFQNMDK